MTDAATHSDPLLAALDRLAVALARRDAATAHALFAPDGDTLLVGSARGEVARGPEAIRALLDDLTAQLTLTFDWDWREATAAGEVGWLLADGRFRATGDGVDLAGPYRVSLVLQRRGGAWLIRQYHGSEPSTTGQEAAG